MAKLLELKAKAAAPPPAAAAAPAPPLMSSSDPYAADFFGRAAYLTVSGQLSAETYACALGDVYTFGPTFRAENSNTFSRKNRASVASYQSRTSPPRPGNFSATTQQRSPAGGTFFPGC